MLIWLWRMPQALFRTLLAMTCLLAMAGPAHARLIGVVVGVSNYANPKLAREAIPGAALDATAMAAMLRQRGAAEGDLTLLTGQHATASAIRAAIARALAQARAGDRVVLYLSGHGAQVPARPRDPMEPDGLDELLLAADAAPWDRASRTVPGAIRDDEIGAWIDQLRGKGADVWFVVDACNGGGLQRGGSTGASPRVLDPALLELPAPVRGGRPDGSFLADASPMTGGGKLVTFYAAPAGGIAWERPLPAAGGTPERRGVFTWSLLRAMDEAPASANFLKLAEVADAARRALGPPGGPAWLGGDLALPVLFSGDGTDLLAFAQGAAPPAALAVQIAVGPSGTRCPGEDPDRATLTAPAGPLRIHGCRRVLVSLQSSADAPMTIQPWYRDAAGAYVALAGPNGILIAPRGRQEFRFTVTDRDPDSGKPLPSGAEYLLLIAPGEARAATIVPLITGG
ncbi:MAG: caspase family protein [Sphingomonadales bacterium]|nr:MAG: caspase family protein [Sphingomonadales bacterium]